MSSNVQTALSEMLPWLGILLAIVLIGGVLLFYLRHHLFGRSDPGEISLGILKDLQNLRDRGEISHEEYEDARLKMIARATGRDFDQLKADAIRKAGGVVAEPGKDLLGRPLPKPPVPPTARSSPHPPAPPTPPDPPDPPDPGPTPS